MNNEYKYDKVNNVLSVANIAPLPTEKKAMGGQMKHTYEYDNLYRLTGATGTYLGANKKTAKYSLSMAYDKLHNITSKEQNIQQMGVTFDGKLSAGYKLDYTYGKKPHQIDNIKDENYRTEGKDVKTPKKTENVYEYDENGNLIFVSKNKSKDEKQNERKLLWDEENRLEAVSDNGYVSLYTYDAGGERVAKLSGNGESVYVNSLKSGARTQTNKYTAYISPYFVLSSGGQYTKHIMIGSQRIVSKLGDVKSFGQDPRRIEYAGTTESIKVDYKAKYIASQRIIKEKYKRLKVVYNGVDNNDYRGGESFCCGKKKDGFKARSSGGGITNNDKPELFQYYYHPDHLGSSSYITNLDGEVAQHIEYVPFGEVFLNEQNNKWNTPYLFNGKELDEETGLYYYGARYYNPRTSQWISVDAPLINGKYLNFEHDGGVLDSYNLGSYLYCRANPVIYTDPDGNQVRFEYTLDYTVNYPTGWKRYLPFNYPTTTIHQTGKISNYSMGELGENGGFTIILKVPKVYVHNLKNPSYDTYVATGNSLDNLEWTQERSLGEVFQKGFNNGWKVGLSETMMEVVALKIVNQFTKNFSRIINTGKQGKHILGHNNFQKGRSILTEDAQGLLDNFHKGAVKSMRKINKTKMNVDFGKVIGKYFEKGTTKGVSTTRGTIINSKSGVHIVPSRPN